jgi:hypothetical protein
MKDGRPVMSNACCVGDSKAYRKVSQKLKDRQENAVDKPAQTQDGFKKVEVQVDNIVVVLIGTPEQLFEYLKVYMFTFEILRQYFEKGRGNLMAVKDILGEHQNKMAAVGNGFAPERKGTFESK